MTERAWYVVDNADQIDSPALLIYLERVKANISTLIKSIDHVSRLRPHIKTCKSPDAAKLMINAGIKKYKCATIAEAEMLINAGADDILLAYQPVGPKAQRIVTLIERYPLAKLSCLIDNADSAKALNHLLVNHPLNLQLDCYIDLNVGMNRTGIVPEDAQKLFADCQSLKNISIIGLHAYDGHIRDIEYDVRKKKCDEAFKPVEALKRQLDLTYSTSLNIIAGGTPTYSIHCKRKEIECSPGTFIYWDKGYDQILPEQEFEFAALVLSRVISIPTDDTICIDLGHKAIASENPLNSRVYFLNAPELEPVGHSEEHMVLKTKGKKYKIGDILFGVPYHVCPTVALHAEGYLVEEHYFKTKWPTVSRNRKLTV